MKKTTIVALVATLGLSVSASAYESSQVSVDASASTSEALAPIVNSVLGGVDSLLDSTARGVSNKAVGISYDGSNKAYKSTARVVGSTWKYAIKGSAAIVTPVWDSVVGSKNVISKSVVYKSVVNVSTDVLTSDASLNSRNLSENVGSEYSVAVSKAGTFLSDTAWSGIELSANAVNNSVMVTVNGAKASANWLDKDVSKADNKSAAPVALSKFVASKFVAALKSSAEASTDFVLNTDWAKSGLTVSLVKGSTSAYNGVKDTSGVVWLVVSSGVEGSYDKVSEGEYSQASEVLLMLPLGASAGVSAVSASTKKDDELGSGDLPGAKGE